MSCWLCCCWSTNDSLELSAEEEPVGKADCARKSASASVVVVVAPGPGPLPAGLGPAPAVTAPGPGAALVLAVVLLRPDPAPTCCCCCCGASAAIACCDRLLCLPRRPKLGILEPREGFGWGRFIFGDELARQVYLSRVVCKGWCGLWTGSPSTPTPAPILYYTASNGNSMYLLTPGKANKALV